MNILLAEDDSSIQAIAVLSLTKVGKHQVTTVNNGQEALDVLAKQSFDLILLDVMMPKLDGFETCKKIKTDATYQNQKDTPVIFLTAKAQGYEVQHGMSLGAIGYILKPFDPMTLPKQVEEVLSNWKKNAA